MAKLRMAHASTHGARKPPGPKSAKNKKVFTSTTEHQEPFPLSGPSNGNSASESDPESSDAETAPNLVEGDIKFVSILMRRKIVFSWQ